jgi:hypothetical protein
MTAKFQLLDRSAGISFEYDTARFGDVDLRKRDADPGRFDLPALAAASDGFSGAEIKQAAGSALYLARERRQPLDGHHLLEELRQTRPLSVVMAGKIDELPWAFGRTVPA